MAIDHDARRAARARALSTARAVTLGLAVGLTGCEQVADGYCRTFARGSGIGDGTSYCCARRGGSWDAASGTCTSVFAMPGPFVPPSAA